MGVGYCSSEQRAPKGGIAVLAIFITDINREAWDKLSDDEKYELLMEVNDMSRKLIEQSAHMRLLRMPTNPAVH